MVELVYDLNNEWPKVERAVQVFQRIIGLLAPVESLNVTSQQGVTRVTILVLPEHVQMVRELAEKIMRRARPK